MKLIVEHFVTVFDKDKDIKDRYVDQVWDLLERTYEPLGGTHSNKQELLMPGILWKLVRREGDRITAAVIYKLKWGRKAFLAGSDGTIQGKTDLKKIMKEDSNLFDRHFWAEVSHGAERAYSKAGAVPIPNELAKEILKIDGKNVTNLNPDGYHYSRKIGNDEYEKLMVGNIDWNN